MQSKNGSYEQIDIIISQMLKRQRVKERYDTERKIRFQGCVSKDLISSSSKNRQTRIFSNNKTANDIESVILSQPQLNQNKRVIKTGSKTKYDSMQKLRKEFLKNGYTSYEYSRTESQRKIIDVPETRVVDDKIGIQQLHYQLVKLHQNVRKMHHER